MTTPPVSAPAGSPGGAPAPAPTRPAPPQRLPLRRPSKDRWVAGVCAGLAAHLAVPVQAVRVGFVALSAIGGIGVLLYIWLWVMVPFGDPYDAAQAEQPVAASRLASRLRSGTDTWPVTDIAVGIILLAVAGVLVAARAGVDVETTWVFPSLILLAGTGLAWSQLDGVQRERWLSRAGGRTPVSVVRLLAGLALVGIGIVLLLAQNQPFDAVLRAGVAALAVLAGAALALAPWWLRLMRELGEERAARAREAERADIAAHLHDSVLQTLALIRARPDDAETVARLARAQERELRRWLYDDRADAGTSVASALREVVAEVEDTRGGEIETVIVGDCAPDARTDAVVQATREALVNALTHGAPPVSLYMEVRPEALEVFVRDHGDGFDVDQIAPDRFGVRESIMGRVRRRGGTVRLRSRESGTEVHLTMPRPQEETA